MSVTEELHPFGATARPNGFTPHRRVALLDVDPDLGAGLAPDRRGHARAELTATVALLPRGEWAGSALSPADNQNVGLLLLLMSSSFPAEAASTASWRARSSSRTR